MEIIDIFILLSLIQLSKGFGVVNYLEKPIVNQIDTLAKDLSNLKKLEYRSYIQRNIEKMNSPTFSFGEVVKSEQNRILNKTKQGSFIAYTSGIASIPIFHYGVGLDIFPGLLFSILTSILSLTACVLHSSFYEYYANQADVEDARKISLEHKKLMEDYPELGHLMMKLLTNDKDSVDYIAAKELYDSRVLELQEDRKKELERLKTIEEEEYKIEEFIKEQNKARAIASKKEELLKEIDTIID